MSSNTKNLQLGNSNAHYRTIQQINGKKARQFARKSIKEYKTSSRVFTYGKVNDKFPFFLFYYLWRYQKKKCFFCKESLKNDDDDDEDIVLSHDISHDRNSKRYTSNVMECNKVTYLKNQHPDDQYETFDPDMTEDTEVDLLNDIGYFSLIHRSCNGTLSNRKCPECSRYCDNIFCRLGLIDKVDYICDARIAYYDKLFPVLYRAL